ncbi:MAG: T9SS type A sorting domain-containing protein [Chitinophagales bacterium]|nr:T9SS type A sorting domain-containing protein [Chitinophagales bacterium]
MKRLYIAFLMTMGAAVAANAQSLERQVIGAAGGYDVAGGVSLSYTVGEPIVETAISGSIILTQGFQQPDDLGVGIKEVSINVEYTVFPNPTDDILFVDLKSDKPADVKLTFFNIAGQQMEYLTQAVTVNGKTRLQFSLKDLAAGQYILVLNDKAGNPLRNFKIQKLN